MTVGLVLLAWFGGNRILNEFRPDIEANLTKTLGRQVTIGKAVAQIYPQPGLYLKDVIIAGRAKDCLPLKAQGLSMELELDDALRGAIVISLIELRGLNYSLFQDGTNLQPANLQGTACAAALPLPNALGATPAETPVLPPPANPPVKVEQQERFGIDWDLQELQIEDAELTIYSVNGKKHLLKGKLQTQGGPQNGLVSLKKVKLDLLYDEVPAKISIAELNYNIASKNLSVSAGEFASLKNLLKITGTADLPNSQFTGQISSEKLDIATFAQTLKQLSGLRQINDKGQVNINLNLEYSPTRFMVSGSAKGKDLIIFSKSTTARELNIKDGSFLSENGKDLINIKDFSASDLAIKTGTTSYRSKDARGSLNYGKPTAVNGTARLSVAGFEFDDKTTLIQNVTATAEKIDFSWSKKQGLQLKTNLLGSSVYLKAPQVEVLNARSVSGPLALSIPSGPGYSVSGTANVVESEMQISARRLEKLGGLVNFAIDQKGMTYKNFQISGQHQKRNWQAKGNLTSSAQEHLLNIQNLTINKGQLSGNLRMQRTGAGRINFDVQAKGLPIEDTYPLVANEGQSSASGVIKSFSGKFQSNSADFMKNLKGMGKFELLNNKIKGFNLQSAVADALAAIPFAGQQMVLQDYRNSVQDHTTTADFLVENQQVQIKSLAFNRTNFTGYGKGTINFDGTIDGAVRIVFLKQALKMLGVGIDPLAKLFSSAGQITFHFLVSGTVTKPNIAVNKTALAKQLSGVGIAESVIKGSIKGGTKIFDVLTGGDWKSTPTPTPVPTPFLDDFDD